MRYRLFVLFNVLFLFSMSSMGGHSALPAPTFRGLIDTNFSQLINFYKESSANLAPFSYF